MDGQFIISLDFELLWGVRDTLDRGSYGKNILEARSAIPRMLELFSQNRIHATWATVGLLFCESQDEMIHSSPPEELRPQYSNNSLSNYNFFSELGRSELDDPYYFAPSLIRAIAQTPGQEIATHTFSHFYPLEPGATVEAFAADLSAARSVALRHGISLKSIVFPRNQYGPDHIEVCKKAGLTSWRGNAKGWAYKPTSGVKQTLLRRGLRLLDAYSGILGSKAFSSEDPILGNVPASHFLRPRAGPLAGMHFSHVATIKRGMTHAAQSGRGYHLWWHPHNFGQDLDANLAGLKDILRHFQVLRSNYNMRSLAMCETHDDL